MFTGIVQEIGLVKSVSRKKDNVELTVSCEKIKEGLELGDSVAVNGVCLSVTDNTGDVKFDVVKNTFSLTNLKRLKAGSRVNLENAMKLGDKVSGHMVSGHIDGERIIKKNTKTSNGWVLEVSIKPGDEKYMIPKGSVSIDGVSLTIGEIYPGGFKIFLIPHTLDNTILKDKKAGDYINVEFDMMSKYTQQKNKEGSITKDFLQKKGFM